MKRNCDWCGREFEPTRRDNIYCSKRCRNRASEWRSNGGWDFDPVGLAKTGREKPVSVDEVASAVVGIRNSISVLGAATIAGKPEMRPLCSRLESALVRALEAEGL